MKFLKPYSIFESLNNQFFKTESEIKNWLNEMLIDQYTIGTNLIVNTKGDVDISYKGLDYIPVQFERVGGVFDCGHNQLKSLKGGPIEIGSSFYCDNNQLTSFEGWPNSINGFLDSYNNPVHELLKLLQYNPEFSLDLLKYINEYNVIKGNTIFFDNLKDAIYMSDMEKAFNYNTLYDRLSKLKNYNIVK